MLWLRKLDCTDCCGGQLPSHIVEWRNTILFCLFRTPCMIRPCLVNLAVQKSKQPTGIEYYHICFGSFWRMVDNVYPLNKWRKQLGKIPCKNPVKNLSSLLPHCKLTRNLTASSFWSHSSTSQCTHEMISQLWPSCESSMSLHLTS